MGGMRTKPENQATRARGLSHVGGRGEVRHHQEVPCPSLSLEEW
jgi:hypothetical protein